MSDRRFPDAPEEPSDVATVAEYVLGLLPPEEAAALEARFPREPALAALHGEWADAFAGLERGPDVAPPAGLRARAEARVFGAPAAPAPRRRWLGWAGLLGAPVAAVAAAFLLLAPPAFDPSIHVDVVVPEIGLNVAAGADEDTLRIINVAGTPAPGRAYELWLIVGDAAPVSLGLLPESGQIDIPRPEGLETGVTFAVSDEPAGGSPTGAPTGPILGAETFFDL